MYKIQKLTISLSSALFTTIALALPAHADANQLQCGVLNDLCKIVNAGGDFNSVIAYFVQYLMSIIGIVLAIVILVSSIQFVTSGGSPDRIKSAKDRLVQAAVSLGLLISFNAIFNLLENNIFKGISGTSLDEVQTLGSNVIAVLLTAVGVLAVIFIIIGGIQYSTSAGDPNKVSTAKSTITYAIIGLAMSLSIGAVISLLNLLAT